jgi:hypothetical protein
LALVKESSQPAPGRRPATVPTVPRTPTNRLPAVVLALVKGGEGSKGPAVVLAQVVLELVMESSQPARPRSIA